MTNPKTRKTGKAQVPAAASGNDQSQQRAPNRRASQLGRVVEEECEMSSPWVQQGERHDVNELQADVQIEDAEDDEDEDEVADSCSSFSLQECIDEFRARRIRRISTQSRDAVQEDVAVGRGTVGACDIAEVDLINQNRSNKEFERMSKPCQNGFCYCFTSDSGDGGCGVRAARGTHVRHAKRTRKSETAGQHPPLSPQRQTLKTRSVEKLQSPKKKVGKKSSLKVYTPTTASSSKSGQLTAFSRLETTSADEAPLIHIIQELHNNCVISEVRVNKHKLQTERRSHSLGATPSTSASKRTHFKLDTPEEESAFEEHEPTAPNMEEISDLELTSGSQKSSALQSSSLSSYSVEYTTRRRHKLGGRLLQKRLSRSHKPVEPRDFAKPPPKPPRVSAANAEKLSVSSLASTSPSVREAERTLDEFLERRCVGISSRRRQSYHTKTVQCQTENVATELKQAKRKSYPSTFKRGAGDIYRNPLPTYPSLSDIERAISGKKSSNYTKNMQESSAIKDVKFGWKEPKITEMLHYDKNANQKKFVSQATQAEPQSLGWHIPPKNNLDTVDSGLNHNLAANFENKHTPIKTEIFQAPKQPKLNAKEATQKFIWYEQFRSLKPWHSGKSSGKSSASKFINSSRKKLMRLVSPKKIQRSPPQASARTIATQTTPQDSHTYEPSLTPQSPPGSYHSARQTTSHVQSSTSQLNTQSEAPQFDFSRTVTPPPKKAPRPSISRKLNFPEEIDVIDGKMSVACKPPSTCKTYRAYHSELDQDVTLSKMGFILSNIRAKLEASDELAIRTFQEIERREQQALGFDTPDGHTRADVHRRTVNAHHNPIYSEIEEDSIHISSSPQFDNTTGTQPAIVNDIGALYAQVIKKPKVIVESAPSASPLAKVLRDSLKTSFKPQVNTDEIHFPALPEPPPSSDVSYSSPNCSSSSGAVLDCQSLNNIRVMEQHSPPKNNRHLSKSDLSLHRSEIFLENLCRSELVFEGSCLERLEKTENHKAQSASNADVHNASFESTSTKVSYEMPVQTASSTTSDSHMDSQLNLTPQQTRNQSTPKKDIHSQNFITKFIDEETQRELELDLSSHISPPSAQKLYNQSKSCPTTPRRLPSIPDQKSYSLSLNEVCTLPAGNDYETLPRSSDMRDQHSEESASTPTKLAKRLKNALRRSYKKSKAFVKCETRRLSTSLLQPLSNSTCVPAANLNQSDLTDYTSISHESTFNLETLFGLDETLPVPEQLARAVNICRQLPDLEISPEMVEAERLLLFSTLQREAQKQQRFLVENQQISPRHQLHTRRYFIDEMQLPVKADAKQDIFFNYFYICTFECAGVVKSTHSEECRDHQVIFRDCGIEFSSADEAAAVRCEIFMLRLRKVSTLSLEPRKNIVKKLKISQNASPSSSTSSGGEIVSRFRLHASFTLQATHFIPYEYVDCETKHSPQICLRSATTLMLPLTSCTKSSNLCGNIALSGRAEVRFPKLVHRGFLNVQDPFNQHNWNRRWCTLEGLQLFVWPNTTHNINEETPLLNLDLLHNTHSPLPLTAVSRELCARPRSFCLQYSMSNSEEEATTAAVFFGAENQTDLENWLLNLNQALRFIIDWMA